MFYRFAPGNKAPWLNVLCVFAVLLCGCQSRVISHAGLKGRFVWEDTGEPIAGVSVKYEDPRGLVRRTTTGADGAFVFSPVFSSDYTGFPVKAVGLQAAWSLEIAEKHNPSASVGFVRHTDVRNATLDAGVIWIPAHYRNSLRGGLPLR